ncbi:trans-sulfuration enzyme family protein [Clostridium felsineum]|uniref:cysteine-S-conjugate beta-lyase n=1 Tax=Clostridium felsineum TaxID=36839 RepID=A0A1S8KXD3_9CLOT|nr:PLP-dependent aspartate aminotransferase family protein [Clostridium felsineum]URZ04932.1 Cystathionine beta-lyase MetC [Clostridium felsineum]URZ09973.1 Cystathionine beta-lyase MetC [Clostridium felsineum]
MKFGTKIIHSGFEGDKRTGAITTPIYQTSTFHQENIDGNIVYDYSRSGNPTREALEKTIALLEGGYKGFAFSSGMAAISSVLSIFSAHDHIIVPKDVYGGTYRITTEFFSKFEVECEFVDTTNIEEVRYSIKDNTKAIYIETPSNPLMKVTNIREIVKLAKEFNLLVIADNTFMSPYLQRPLELGVDIVVHSATKFLNGHSDIIAGLVVAKTKELADKIYFVQNAFGAVLSPQDSWLLLRGIKTLKIRLNYQQNNATELAKWLLLNKFVDRVYYPGMPSHIGREIHFSQASGAGAVLSFEASSTEKAKSFMKKIKCAAVGVSLGGVETIISYPAKMSHAEIPHNERIKLGIGDNLIRVSVGLEDLEDLIENFKIALE